MPTKKPIMNVSEKTILVVSLEEATAKISDQLAKGNELLGTSIATLDELAGLVRKSRTWRDVTAQILKTYFNTEEPAREFEGVIGIHDGSRESRDLDQGVNLLHSDLGYFIGTLESIFERLPVYPAPANPHQSIAPDVMTTVELIARRFHLVARQLRQRHQDRATLDIIDEYDVQDLFHALLRLFFDDIRNEEWTPSYAGGAARMDFLLKAEQVVIELKKTHQGLGSKEVGTQLIEDISRYQSHQDCRSLLCFVYDPEGRITNPDGLERDLSHHTNGIKVVVIVAPKGQ